ncbi:hypothetical protein BGZ61DRAFT_483587 [Ilyonectria robusta]|uniref:uncharacterized protein n=1 Tax=Ilyonectria robusta TaxID=1079257 RepID=UPI001E8EE715|nr:uncharacterized protein BGZ61DRAFT_483587 [Ilyonectria robusta]KAH8669431.1 hypothetical protein BGZ61DRAFT_483587 [Ilyonectria robusta]
MCLAPKAASSSITTGSSSLTIESASAAIHAGFSVYLHGTILVMPHQIGLPEPVSLISGKHETFTQIEPALPTPGAPQLISTEYDASAALGLSLVVSLCGVASGFVQTVVMLKQTALFKDQLIQGLIKTLWIPKSSVASGILRHMETTR